MSHPHPDLGAPPALPRNGLRVVALGGLGEVGRNMAVFEHRGKLLIIDCGVLFPEEHQPGVDVILPDFSFLRGRWQDVVGVVLTHEHEDHIGGVPYLLKERVKDKDELERALREVVDGRSLVDPRIVDKLVSARLSDPGIEKLTPREREVAELVSQGLTNRAIAQVLVISEGTVRAHVEHILSKLGLRSRTEIGTRLEHDAQLPRTQ